MEGMAEMMPTGNQRAKDVVWGEFRNCQPPLNFSVKSTTWILDKQLDMASAHSWGQIARCKQNPEPS